MTKFETGDIAVITRRGSEHGCLVKIKGWRGGRVAPYVVEFENGKVSYFPGRDMEPIDMSMSGKHKVYCVHEGCNTYSFESVAVLEWQCFLHYPNKFNCVRKERVVQTRLTPDEKIDLILDYLGLEIKTEPEVVKVEKKEE